MAGKEDVKQQLKHQRRLEVLKKKTLGKAPILRPPPQVALRWVWGYTPGIGVLLFLGWLVGFFLPLTVIIPMAFLNNRQGELQSGCMLIFVVGLPLLNYVFITQSHFSSKFYDRMQRKRLMQVDGLVDVMLDTDDSQSAKRATDLLRETLSRYLWKQKSARLRKLHIVPLCKCFRICNWSIYRRGRFLCWNRELVGWFSFVFLMVVPVAILLPLGFSSLNLEYTFGAEAIRGVLVAALVTCLLVYLIWTVYRVYYITKRAGLHSPRTQSCGSVCTMLRSGLRDKKHKARRTHERFIAGAPVQTEDEEDNAMYLGKFLALVVNCLPGWIYREMFYFWSLCVVPLVFLGSLVGMYDNYGYPTAYFSSQSVKKYLKTSGFLLLALFCSGFLLIFSILRREIACLTSAESVEVFVKEELLYMKLAKKNDWKIESLGDYPNFSIGEGLYTDGVLYHDTGGFSIVLRRFYVNLLLFLNAPIIFIAVALQWIQHPYVALALALVVGPGIFVFFYSSILFWGVTPKRRRHGVYWYVLWILVCFFFPIIFGALIVRYAERSNYLGVFYVVYGIVTFITSMIVWTVSEWKSLRQWTKKLSVQQSWLLEFAEIIFKFGMAGTLVCDFGAILISALLSALSETLYSLLMVLTFFGNSFALAYFFFGILAGAVKVYEGVSRPFPYIGMLFRWTVFTFSWVSLYYIDDSVSGHVSFIDQNFRVRRLMLIFMVIVLVFDLLYSIHLYKQYLVKVEWGYFPSEWEYAGGSGRPRKGVVEMASRVVEYDTDAIVGDLRRRGVLELSAKELLAMYLDTSRPHSERLSYKNRFVRLCTRELESREKLEELLETEIAKDYELLLHAQALADSQKNQQLLSQTKTYMIREKFADVKGEWLYNTMQEEVEDESDGDGNADLHEEAENSQRVVSHKRINVRAKELENESCSSSSEDDSDDSDDSDDALMRKLAKRKSGGVETYDKEAGERRVDFYWNIVEYFQDNVHIDIYEVAKVESWLQHLHVPKNKLFVFGADPAYKRLNYVLIMDKKNRRLLFVGYRIWEITKVPFEWIQSLEWYPSYNTKQNATRIDLVIESPRSVSIRSSPSVRSHRFYFQTFQERESFCMNFYQLTCTHGLEPAKILREGISGMFDFDNNGFIYQLPHDNLIEEEGSEADKPRHKTKARRTNEIELRERQPSRKKR